MTPHNEVVMEQSPRVCAAQEHDRRRAACGQGDSVEEMAFDPSAEGGRGIWKAWMEGRTNCK